MKATVTISKVVFGAAVENNFGSTTQLVNFSLVEPLLQGKINEDGEKEIKSVRQMGLNINDFDRILCLNEYTAILPEVKLQEEQKKLPEQEQLAIKYENHIRALKGAKLTLEKEEVYEAETEEDENGEVKNKVDAEGKVIKKLVAFGDTKYISLTISPIAEQFCMNLMTK